MQKGTHHTPEARAKISESKRGKPMPDRTRRQIGVAMRSYWHQKRIRENDERARINRENYLARQAQNRPAT